ncbi:MAG TPA: DUF4255 domain-containing protein [Anaerolineaceae bacterium]|nr:DUF4255 domain-containing protein [Anaerolineaceae bacterium]
MFDALDESIKNLLVKEMPIRKNEIDIVFDQPTDEWSGAIGKPTLNLFLYNIQENRQLRGAEQFSEIHLPDGRVEIRANPARVDLSYLITAWSKKELDQHKMLGMAMMAVMRSPFLPEDCYTDGLRGHSMPVPLSVAQSDEAKDWSDFWSTMHNKLRPGLTLRATLTIDPYVPTITSTVHTTDMQFQQEDPLRKTIAISRRYWSISGEVLSQKYSPASLSITWEEKGIQLENKDGHFVIEKIEPGSHHIAIRLNDRILKRQAFTVPSTDRLTIEV